MAEKPPRVRLGVNRYVKISQVLTSNREQWCIPARPLKELCELAQKECGFEIPLSSFRVIVKELDYPVRVSSKSRSGNSAKTDRVRVLAGLINQLFSDLERELGIEPGKVGARNGSRERLRAICGGKTNREPVGDDE